MKISKYLLSHRSEYQVSVTITLLHKLNLHKRSENVTNLLTLPNEGSTLEQCNSSLTV